MPKKVAYDVGEFRKMWESGVPVRDIGNHYRVGHNWPSAQAARLGLKRRQNKLVGLPIYAMQVAYEQGKTASEITIELRSKFPTLSPTTVLKLLRRRGVAMKPSQRRSQVVPAECVRLFRAGYSRAAIARMLKSNVRIVSHHIRRVMGAGKRGGGPKVNVPLILSLWREGIAHREIGKRVGCAHSVVQYHVRKA